jgi:hypothetical protein
LFCLPDTPLIVIEVLINYVFANVVDWRAFIKAHIVSLLEQRKLRHNASPYVAPTLITSKKPEFERASTTFRMVIDFRRLNADIDDKYAMPHVYVLLDALQGSVIFTLLDLRSRFHQVLVRKEDIPKTAFRTMEGHYE